MTAQLQLAALAGFAGLMVIAAVEDFRRLIIPNALTLALCLLWPLYLAAAAPSLFGILGALGCAAIVFLAGALCFSRGYMGGGDVKLLTAATLWAGPAATPALLMLTGLLGGALALLLLIPASAHLMVLARAKLAPAADAPDDEKGTPVPYGLAIASAALIVIFLPYFN